MCVMIELLSNEVNVDHFEPKVMFDGYLRSGVEINVRLWPLKKNNIQCR